MKTNFHYFWCFWLVVSRKSTITVDIRTFFAKKLLVEEKKNQFRWIQQEENEE
jgi:hypothetical protein